eukprot:Pgem_evm2s18609
MKLINIRSLDALKKSQRSKSTQKSLKKPQTTKPLQPPPPPPPPSLFDGLNNNNNNNDNDNTKRKKASKLHSKNSFSYSKSLMAGERDEEFGGEELFRVRRINGGKGKGESWQ